VRCPASESRQAYEELQKLGKEADEDQRLAMVPLLKAKALEKKDLLTEEEFLEIYQQVVT